MDNKIKKPRIISLLFADGVAYHHKSAEDIYEESIIDRFGPPAVIGLDLDLIRNKAIETFGVNIKFDTKHWPITPIVLEELNNRQ